MEVAVAARLGIVIHTYVIFIVRQLAPRLVRGSGGMQLICIAALGLAGGEMDVSVNASVRALGRRCCLSLSEGGNANGEWAGTSEGGDADGESTGLCGRSRVILPTRARSRGLRWCFWIIRCRC